MVRFLSLPEPIIRLQEPLSIASRQDAALERDMNRYQTKDDDDGNAQKRQRCNLSFDDNMLIVNKHTKLSACCLPAQLHLREIGYYSRRSPPKRSQSYLQCQLMDRMLKTAKGGGGAHASNDNDDLGCFISTCPTTNQRMTAMATTNTSSQWNALQYSAPTYYRNALNDDDDDDDDGITASPSSSSSSSIGINNCISNNNNNSSINTNQLLHTIQTWRPYTRRSIPFSKLCTPYSDAILALDQWGGYLIGVGSGCGSCESDDDDGDDDSMTPPYLSIKFYGVPSPARLHQQQQQETSTSCRQGIIVSPLIHTVPLLFKKYSDRQHDTKFSPSCINLGQQQYNEYASPVAEIPMQFLFSECGSLGVAFLCHSSTTNIWKYGGVSNALSNSSSVRQVEDDDNDGNNILGTIIIFEPPKRGGCVATTNSSTSKMSKLFRLCNVTIAGWRSFTIRNALWPTTVIPTKIESWNETQYLCQHFHRALSAYVLFNDEDDGFRLTWVTIGALDEHEEIFDVQSFTCTSNKIHPTRHDIIATPSEGFCWQECLADTETGYPSPTPNNESNATEHLDGVNVAFEVYLHIDALLSDIISRRRQSSLFKNSPYHKNSAFFMPNFYYNLISASMDTLKVLLVVTFSNKEKLMMHNTTRIKNAPSALGVFVEVNLFDQSYTEVQWVQHPSCVDSSSMKQWCNLLAVNWRMKQCRVGIFCLDSSDIGPHLANWNCNTHECNVDQDMSDDCNVKLWKRYVEEKNNDSKKNIAPPKDVSMSTLYPYCDVITNQAVQNSIPVKRITSRKSPIELTYG